MILFKNAAYNLNRLRAFLHQIDVKFSYFLMAACFSLLAASLEGLSALLLIPLVKGVISMDFTFIRDTLFFKHFLVKLQFLFAASNSVFFILLVSAVFISSAGKSIFQYIASISVAYQVRKISNNLRELIFDKYLGFGKLFFDRNNLGYFNTVLINFTDQVGARIINIHTALLSFFTLLAYIFLMCMISRKLTLFTLAVSPLFYYSVKWIIEKIKHASMAYANAYNDLGRKTFNILSCFPLVKFYSREEHEKKEFSSISRTVARLEYSIDKKNNAIIFLQETVTLVVFILVISATAFIVVKGKIEVAGFLVYFYIIKKAASAFNSLSSFKASLAELTGSLSEIFKMLDPKDKCVVKDGAGQFDGLRKNIYLNKLNFSYIKENRVLTDISFSIEKGRITAIVGPSGAGKTSLVNLILRFYDCPASSIFVDGVDIRGYTIKSLRSHMAFVSQDTLLFNDSLRANIVYGLDDVTDDRFIEVIKKSRLYDFIKKLPNGADTLIGDKGVKLSGGERQRVSIARAMLKKTEILILDEATSFLDTRTEKLIQEAIDEVMQGRTTIVIAHRLSTIKNADKIVVIENGRLVEDGSLDELLDKKKIFYQYWQEQKFV